MSELIIEGLRASVEGKEILKGVDLVVKSGEVAAVMGPNGSGKSTLMHVMAGLDSVTSGQVILADTDITELDDDALTALRRRQIGFVPR